MADVIIPRSREEFEEQLIGEDHERYLEGTPPRCECPESALPEEWVEVPVFADNDPRRNLPIQQTERHVKWCPAARTPVQEVDRA